MLSHWVRDEGLLDVGAAVRKLTSEGAELFGLADRGVLAPGAFADVNVIDLDRPSSCRTPEWSPTSRSAPAATCSAPSGYDYTLVNGQVLIDHDELTTGRPGHLLTPSTT